MGISKNESFNHEQNQLALLAKAFGHPARIAIIEFLLNENSCICNDLVGKLPLAQPTISQHLKELKNVGIIKGSIEGNTICYCLEPKVIQPLLQLFQKIETYKSIVGECC